MKEQLEMLSAVDDVFIEISSSITDNDSSMKLVVTRHICRQMIGHHRLGDAELQAGLHIPISACTRQMFSSWSLILNSTSSNA